MIKTILYWFLALFIIALLAYWVFAGGAGKVADSFSFGTKPDSVSTQEGGLSNFFSNSSFRLPWQPTFGTIPTSPSGNTETSALLDQYATLEGEYELLNAQANDAKVFGDPSPQRSQVRITQIYGAKEGEQAKEYVVLTASSNNTAPIELKNWSLQSAYTGIRAYIPLTASAFTVGILNDQENLLLYPGASAIVNSGWSPVGTSFRENMCSGYLGQFQEFYPPLSNSCPPASGALPFTPENLKVYGDTCFDFLETIPPCTAPLRNIPPNVNPNCRSFAANIFSYNGCIASNRFRPTFNSSTWRIFLGSNAELWRNTHDIIRLLDGEGRTVDVVTY